MDTKLKYLIYRRGLTNKDGKNAIYKWGRTGNVNTVLPSTYLL
jgi:hypothetical protein